LPIPGDDFRTAPVSFNGGFRMKGKLGEFYGQIKFGFEFLDTPGDEVAPGSNEI